MAKVPTLMEVQVPITFLTATLPPRLEPVFKQLLRLPEKYKMIRMATNRPEHQYVLLRTDAKKLVDHAIMFIREATTLLSNDQRAIVFVREKDVGRKICSAFPKMGFINSDVKDEDVRSEIMSDWEAGRSEGWIAGTTSLIQGIDYHNVRLVLFVGSPDGMIDFVQGAGRAGRNGANATIVVLQRHGWLNYGRADRNDLTCTDEMYQWVENLTVCRRSGISKCMDGVEITCRALPRAAHCDICKTDHDIVPIWKKATEAMEDNKEMLGTSKPTAPRPTLNLTPRAQTTSTSRAGLTPQIPVPPLQPRPHSRDVVQNSKNALDRSKQRVNNAQKCIELLMAFSPNCGICYAASRGKTLTGRRHESWSKCVGIDRKIFASFYDWNKPTSKEVRGLFSQALSRCH